MLALNRVRASRREGRRYRRRRDEDAALSRAAQLTVERLAARGLTARIVSERLNRRKIDLIPGSQWEDPPKARIGPLLKAVENRLAAVGVAGLPETVEIARAAAAEAGLADPKVTGDAKHVEIGLTDKSDSGRWVMSWLWQRGIAPEQVLIAGDELGPRLPGASPAVAADVGRVSHRRCGGPEVRLRQCSKIRSRVAGMVSSRSSSRTRNGRSPSTGSIRYSSACTSRCLRSQTAGWERAAA